jgi:threonine dehydratase
VSAEVSQTACPSPPVSAADIDAAAERISDVVSRTPLQYSERLSEGVGATVYLKREDLQVVRSYKLRGANNLLRPSARPMTKRPPPHSTT